MAKQLDLFGNDGFTGRRNSTTSKLELLPPSEHIYMFVSSQFPRSPTAEEARRLLGRLTGQGYRYKIPVDFSKGSMRDDGVRVLYSNVVDYVLSFKGSYGPEVI
ncbi:hypothetical protein FJZ21_01805 [Candidatus Pacearchaeota archaeon]|nr:hypothetical protein [Candidatus Pacearchaeota archaeon]